MSQSLQLLTSCDVPDCAALSTQMLDRNGPVPWGLPDGWFQIAENGKLLTICPRHRVVHNWFVDGVRFDV